MNFEVMSWQEYFKSTIVIKEDAEPTNVTTGVENTDSPPLFKVTKFAGTDCIEVDDDTYHKCKFGKKPYARWAGVIEDEALRGFVQKHYQKNSKLMIQNSKSGSMIYMKRGD
jgi:hypothetical protein